MDPSFPSGSARPVGTRHGAGAGNRVVDIVEALQEMADGSQVADFSHRRLADLALNIHGPLDDVRRSAVISHQRRSGKGCEDQWRGRAALIISLE